MPLLTIILIALGLSMDAFAVSITSGLTLQKIKITKALQVAFLFGLFQFGMPILGWFLGKNIEQFISRFDHWIAAILLSYVGEKMIKESLSRKQNKEQGTLPFPKLLLLAIATSIDALAVGLSFALLKTEILKPSIIIGIITFFVSLLGIYIGKKTGTFLQRKAEFVGGLILVGIALKILLEHLTQ